MQPRRGRARRVDWRLAKHPPSAAAILNCAGPRSLRVRRPCPPATVRRSRFRSTFRAQECSRHKNAGGKSEFYPLHSRLRGNAVRYTAPPCFAQIFEVRIDMISAPIFPTAKFAFKVVAAAAVMAGWAADASSQAYPARPVTVVV